MTSGEKSGYNAIDKVFNESLDTVEKMIQSITHLQETFTINMEEIRLT